MKTRLLTTEKIICAATDLFLLKGFGSVSMDLIAEKAAVTKVTVYQHFDSKEALLLQCLRSRLETREAFLEAHFRDRPAAPAQILELFDWTGRKAAACNFNGCAFLKATIEMASTFPEVRAIALQAKRLLRKRMLSMLRDANGSDTKTLADTLALLLEGAQALSLVEQSLRPFTAAKREAAHLLAPWLTGRRLATSLRLES